jgi:predicted  nucleic acid-binding Zn-ribbon protein
VVLLGFILLIIFGYKNFKIRLKDFIKQKRNLTELETTHEKLKVKTHELEKYIGDLKSKVKHIATIEDKSTQRDSIRGLYRTINAESSNIENSEKLRIEVLKELNSPFFKNIEENHPDLSDIEYLICYYLKLGFKNKEIAFFLDRTIRSIESQRYRISKKMNLDNSKFLFDYLSSNY